MLKAVILVGGPLKEIFILRHGGRRVGLKFSPLKTTTLPFTSRHKIGDLGPVFMGGVQLALSNQAKYFGVILDQKLNWGPQLTRIIDRQEPKIMVWLYNAVVRPAPSCKKYGLHDESTELTLFVCNSLKQEIAASLGTRFRPLSLDVPKPLFPVAGLPMIQHHIEACVKVPDLKEILLIGYYPASDLAQFVLEMVQEYKIIIRYLQEFTALGTAGGMYHFRDQIRCGNPDAFFVLNGDVCANFPLEEMLGFHKDCGESAVITVMATEATRQQSLHYGCIIRDKQNSQITHYVEKPSTFVSTLINCGVYICSVEIFQFLSSIFDRKQQDYYNENQSNGTRESGCIQLEQEVLSPLAGTGKAFVMPTTNWWSQIKSAGSAIYANRHYLELYKAHHPRRLATECGATVIGDVYIHQSASVHPTSVIGPNVSIGPGAVIGPGVRIRETIILQDAQISEHSLVLHSIVGRGVRIGAWARVEGTPCDPNPNKPFAKMDNLPLFNSDGRMNPSITILGCSVTVPAEVILLNSIVLPYKELTRSFKNEIIL